jgi:hypothetical protein
MQTSTRDKLAIIRIVAEKCRAAGRKDFEWWQAYYSPSSGQMDMVPLRHLQFDVKSDPPAPRDGARAIIAVIRLRGLSCSAPRHFQRRFRQTLASNVDLGDSRIDCSQIAVGQLQIDCS